MVVAFPAAPIPWNDGITNQPSPAFLAYMTDLQARVTAAEAANATIGNVFLSSQAASNSATIVFTGIDATYDAYQFHLTGLKPSLDGAGVRMQMSINGGSTWLNIVNRWTWLYSYFEGTTTPFAYYSGTAGANDETQFWLGGSVSSSWNHNGEMILYPGAVGLKLNMISFRGLVYYPTTTTYQQIGSGIELSNSTACNAVRFYFNLGNIASGRISMYGIRMT